MTFHFPKPLRRKVGPSLSVLDASLTKLTGTAKTLSDLPYELLTQCYDLLVCELRQETDEGTDEFYSEELKIPELCSPREDIFDLYIRHLFLSALSANRYLRQFAIAEFLRRVQLDPLYTKYFSSASFEEEPTHQGTVDQTDHQKHVLTWRSLFNWLGHVEFFFSPCKMLHDTAILDLIGSVKVILPLEQHEAFRGFGVTTEENGMLILEPRKNELEDYCHVHCGKPSYGPTSTSEVERLLLYKLRIDYRGGA